MKIDLNGRIALVTGASRGIGEAIARRLAEAGAKVLCAARGEEQVRRIADEISAAGGEAEPVVLDISSKEARQVVAGIIEKHGRIDILVNNAGITDDDLFLRMKEDAWNRVVATNLDALFPVTQEIVKKMIRNRWGRVINVTSVVGMMGNPGQTNYAASKAGMIGFTKSLALEIGSRNVTVNAIAPGYIETAMTEGLTGEARVALESRVAIKRLGNVDDIAYAAVYLASEQASYVTGHVLNVSGGLYM